jgi:hypothetical protein
MALKKFIGARYAPEFAGAWSNTKQYAALSVVYADNRSYVSRKTVPAGTPISNTEFWVQSSDWNAQVAEYNLKVEGYNANVEKYNKNVQDYSAAVRGFYADTLHSFDTKADMQADRTLALGETLLTCGDKKIGDGGGSFYQVVTETSVTAVALDNGLFAEPFEFQPYDYSQFQQEVEGYKKSTTRVYKTTNNMLADTGIDTGDTLMTNGAVNAGDGKGRFWNVTNESVNSDSRRLNNGKYATPFMLASVDTANMLNFNSQGAQPAIWGIKEGSTAVNIPMELVEGDIKTVYVAVEYTTGGKGATVNLEISGTQSFNKAFAFNESAPASGTYKTVLYAITGKSEGGSVYTGYATVTSYNTTLEKFGQAITVGVPNNANAEWTGDWVGSVRAYFTVTKPITLKNFTVNTKLVNGTGLSVSLNDDTNSSSTELYNTTVTSTDTVNSKFEPNIKLEPNKKYSFFFVALGTVFPRVVDAPTVTGSYGPFTFQDAHYSGLLTYTED